MYIAIAFVLGIIVGCILATVLHRTETGYGYFRLDKIPEEEDLYTVRVAINPDQNLNHKKRILLMRDPNSVSPN